MALQWVEGAILEVHEWIDLKVPTAAVDINSQILDNVADAAARDNAPNWGQVQDFVTLGREQVDSIKDRDLSDPPGTPATGDRYIVKATGINAWAGLDNDIVEWDGSAWQDQQATEGLTCWVDDEDITVTWNGSAWVQSGGASYYTAAATSGIDITGLAISLDPSALTADTAVGATDTLIIDDGGPKKITFANFEGDISHANLLALTTGDPHTQYQLESERNAANGYAPLDASSDVPNANISSGSVTQHEGDIDHDALTNYAGEQHMKINAGTDGSKGTAAAYGEGFYYATDVDTWYYSDGSSWQTTTSSVGSHSLGGSEHTADTLANFNTKLSDATMYEWENSQTPDIHKGNLPDLTKAELDTLVSDGNITYDGDAPTAHDLDAHGAATLAELNAVVSDATLIDTGDSRLSDARAPTSHAYDSHSGTVPQSDLAGFTKAELDALVSDGNITYDGDAPTAHDLDAHGAATLAELNAVVSDATLIDTGDSRLSDARAPTSHAYDTHSGTVPYTDLGGFTKAQLDGLVSDGNIVYDGDDLSGTYQAVSEKGAASGYPSLDGNSEVTEPILYFHSGVFASLPGAPTAVGQVYAAYDQGRIFFGMNF